MSNEDTKAYLQLQVAGLVQGALNLPVTEVVRRGEELHIVAVMTGDHADAPLYKAIREQFEADDNDT